MTDPRAIMAARNNADWYAMMFDVHGLRYHRTAEVFCAIDTPPPYHSWATLTAADPQVDDLFAPYRDHPHFGLKDACDQRDWSDYGLRVLFKASWIWAAPDFNAATTDWVQITNASELTKWEQAWRNTSPSAHEQFPAPILDRPDVRIWGRQTDAGYDAGVIANLSADCVGLSNCFGRDALPAAATLCTGFGGALPVAGYEQGAELQSALHTGFEETGPLAVWVKAA